MATASASMQVRRRRLFSCTSPRDFFSSLPSGGPARAQSSLCLTAGGTAATAVPRSSRSSLGCCYRRRHLCYHRAMQSALFFSFAWGGTSSPSASCCKSSVKVSQGYDPLIGNRRRKQVTKKKPRTRQDQDKHQAKDKPGQVEHQGPDKAKTSNKPRTRQADRRTS